MKTTSTESANLVPKRRSLGRKARKRRKKALAIQAAAEAHRQAGLSTTGTLSAAPSLIPQDRSDAWPAVKKLSILTSADQQDLVQQLGYLPGNALAVVARVHQAFPDLFPQDMSPLALELYPLVLRAESDSTKSRRKRKRQAVSQQQDENNGDKKYPPVVEPFPTMLWVTNPLLKIYISKLELENRGRAFEERIQKDEALLASMKRAHRAYAKARQELLTEADREWIRDQKWDGAFSLERGVAGIRNFATIKCLHAHAAHYWSGCQDNVVGKWVAEEVTELLGAKQETSTTTKPK